MMKYILWDGTVFWTEEPLDFHEDALVKRRRFRHFALDAAGFDKTSRVDSPAAINRNGITIWRRNGENFRGPFLWPDGRRFIPLGIDM